MKRRTTLGNRVGDGRHEPVHVILGVQLDHGMRAEAHGIYGCGHITGANHAYNRKGWRYTKRGQNVAYTRTFTVCHDTAGKGLGFELGDGLVDFRLEDHAPAS